VSKFDQSITRIYQVGDYRIGISALESQFRPAEDLDRTSSSTSVKTNQIITTEKSKMSTAEYRRSVSFFLFVSPVSSLPTSPVYMYIYVYL